MEKTNIQGIYTTKLKTGDTVYWARFRHPITKKVTKKRLGQKKKDGIKTAKQAYLIFEEIKKTLTNDSQFIQQETFNNTLTLNQIADFYFTEKYDRKKRMLEEENLDIEDVEKHTKTKVKLINQKKAESSYNMNVKPYAIGNTQINLINRIIIDDFIKNDLPKRRLAQKTKFNIIATIKTAINYANQKEIINIANPFQNIKFRNPKNQRDRVLSIDEIALLLQKTKEYKENIHVYLSVYLGYITGARRNTILNIRKSDIDLNNGFIYLYNFKASRKYKMRLTQKALNWLEEKILPYYEDNEYLIRHKVPSKRKNPPEPLGELPRQIYRIMDELFNKGLDKKNNIDRDKVANFHTIRRSVATNLAQNGTPIFEVMKFLNHSNIEQTMIYLNLDSDYLHANVNDLMDTVFDKI